jgi:hypothetical protein
LFSPSLFRFGGAKLIAKSVFANSWSKYFELFPERLYGSGRWPTLQNPANIVTYSMGIWKQIGTYLYLRKRDPNEPKNINISFMHGMNRISIFIFLIAVIIMIVRLFRH